MVPLPVSMVAYIRQIRPLETNLMEIGTMYDESTGKPLAKLIEKNYAMAALSESIPSSRWKAPHMNVFSFHGMETVQRSLTSRSM